MLTTIVLISCGIARDCLQPIFRVITLSQIMHFKNGEYWEAYYGLSNAPNNVYYSLCAALFKIDQIIVNGWYRRESVILSIM